LERNLERNEDKMTAAEQETRVSGDKSMKNDSADAYETGRSVFEWVQALVCAVLAVILVFVFGVRLISVDGTSMLPTLQDGDRLLVLSSLWCAPKDGDVIVLSKKSFMDAPIVKRVIATGGQTVDIDFRTGEVSVDGAVLDEPYINALTLTPGDLEFPFTVGDNCVFVLGDNRNGSTDSRWTVLGEVDRGCIIGKALAVALPGRSADTGKYEWSRIGGID
jgi:signal peptidase I